MAELKLQLTSETKNTEQLSLTQNHNEMINLPSDLRDSFKDSYRGEPAKRFYRHESCDRFCHLLNRLGASYKIKVQKKPEVAYFVLLVDEAPKEDHGICDRCGSFLVDVSWCQYCGDNGWFGEDMANKMGG